ncbi:N-acetylglucosamine kinase [Ferdinandcohnia sp. SAFN-114]|uniref:N-acetylglucosamine kinase n=1 Tax=Ferdinandcohnia sp. SAFN-114 TaxID=3387275 RepID=UPI003F813939
MYILGIDGGGTKTKGVIATEAGTIIAEATVGASNPNNVKKEDLKKELGKLIDILKTESRDTFKEVKRAYAGMSGVDHPSARKEMKLLLESLLPESILVTVNNDAITALYSGTLGKPGVVQIAGTGSITFGLNNEGILDRVGGWGYLLGEGGSGFAVGSEGLQEAFRAHDGLGSRTELTSLICGHFQVETLPEIIHSIYNAVNPKELIASLSRHVFTAADHGDKVAQAIIQKNAIHIGEAVSCLINKQFNENERAHEIPVVLAGGLFNRLDLFKGPMEEIFEKYSINTKLIRPEIEPVGGAVIAGLLEENIKVDAGFIEGFSKEKL